MYVAETRDTLGIPLRRRCQPGRSALLQQGRVAVHCRAARLRVHRPQYGRSRSPCRCSSRRALGRYRRQPLPARHRALCCVQPRPRRQSGSRAGVCHCPKPGRQCPHTDERRDPDQAALLRADSALTASALYDPAVIAPPAAGSFALDPHGVYHTFSGQSSDQSEPGQRDHLFDNALFTTSQFDVDTVNDLRWLNKFVQDPQPVQLSGVCR